MDQVAPSSDPLSGPLSDPEARTDSKPPFRGAARCPGGAERGESKSKPGPRVDLQNRLALRPTEAAAVLGMSPRKFRQISSRLPAVWIDSVKLFPVDALRRWLAEETERQAAHAESEADEILNHLGGSTK